MIILMRGILRALLRLRYRVRFTGLAEVAARGRANILFLPNHPALIDPLIIFPELHRYFPLSAVADQDQINRPLMRWLAPRIGVRPMPDPGKYGFSSSAVVRQVLTEAAADLARGKTLLLYPAGHIARQSRERLGANSAVEFILNQVPDVRVVLIRTRGLWGSRFSRASGHTPHVGRALGQGILDLLANGLVFGPRRAVIVELVEPTDLPRNHSRAALNRYLEDFYNQDVPPRTYVPYTLWERGGVRALPEATKAEAAEAADKIPEATAAIILDYLRKASGKSAIRPEDTLAGDLGLDSLARVELGAWLEREFGFAVGDDVLNTVTDTFLAACGSVAATGLEELKPVPPRWTKGTKTVKATGIPGGDTLTEVFLARARRDPGRVIAADQVSGVKTYRDLITGILALKPEIAKIPGPYVGIMLPASVGAVVVYLATLFAGKIPVMVNWTLGPRSLRHALGLLDVRAVLTVRPLVQRIQSQGSDLEALKDRLVMLEDVQKRISVGSKLLAALQARWRWTALAAVRPAATAVVLFTSGSENLPKAVPLTHTNLLANLRDLFGIYSFKPGDRLLGILPPFHSFGVTVTIAFALCAGVPVVYYPNPTEGGRLAQMIEAYGVTMLVSTPTFLNGILRAAGGRSLATLAVVVSGAEKCPAAVYEALARQLPEALILEGYGITECSPVVAVNDELAPKPFTIGKLLHSLRHAIVDVDTGRRVERGRAGMLLLQGPSVFDGYLNYTGPTPFVDFENSRWYRTGDLVSENADGVMTFRGRLKRFVKLGGEMISLPVIEEVLNQHYAAPADEGPVIAVESTPDEAHPELVLFTTRELDRETANQKLHDAGLSPLHHIRLVRKLDQIPILGTGKTDYRALKGMLKTEE